MTSIEQRARAMMQRLEARRQVGRATADTPLYLFLHVAKNGGSTVSRYLEQAYGSHTIRLMAKTNAKADIWTSVVRARPDLDRLRAIHGHRVFYGLHAIVDREPRYFTFLRHPVARTVSLYNFGVDTGKVPVDAPDARVSFERFLEGPRGRNGMLRFLYYAMETEYTPGYDLTEPTDRHVEVAKQFLDRCWFIGFMEEFDRDLDHLAAVVGPAVADRHVNRSRPHFTATLDPGLERAILAANRYDLELYEYAREVARTRR